MKINTKILKENYFYIKVFYIKMFFFDVKNEINNDDLDLIVNALNMKNRGERVAFIYDTVCDFIDEKMVGCSICDFKKNKCFVQRKNNIDRVNGCCHGCPYQVDKKCTIKNVACKLFFCPAAKKKKKVIKIRNIDIMRLYSIRQKIICKVDFYANREEILNDLNERLFFTSIMHALNRKTY